MSDKRKTKTVEYLVSHMIQTDQPRMFCALELAEDYASKHGGPFCEIFMVTTEKVGEAIDKPQVPVDAGGWWILKLNDGKPADMSLTLFGELEWSGNDLELSGSHGHLHQSEFGQYLWHRIELPEGWE